MSSSRPNILWYCTDQQRFDTIGALGNPHVQTPTLDSLVAEGTAFTHAYCQSPICTPSRIKLHDGDVPQSGPQLSQRQRHVSESPPADLRS